MSRFSRATSRLHICATESFFFPPQVCVWIWSFLYLFESVIVCFFFLHFVLFCVWILNYSTPDPPLVSSVKILMNAANFPPLRSFCANLVGGWFSPKKEIEEKWRKREQIIRKLRASEDNHLVWKWLLWKLWLSSLSCGPFGVAHFCVTVGTN